MRRVILLFSLFVSLCASAQYDYQQFLKTLPEMSDRQALYALQRYQTFFPRKPHPCYLLAKLNYKLQAQEHALANYNEKYNMLYLSEVYFGNCSALLGNDELRASMYPDVEQKGFSETQLRGWLLLRASKVKHEREQLKALYAAYSAMVNDYDSCLQVFTALTGRYTRHKDLLLVLDSLDETRLSRLETLSSRMPENIRRFREALEVYPVPDYNPSIRLRPISFYRLEGLTGSDFLQPEVLLWDYAGWAHECREQLKEVARIRSLMNTEQERLAARRPGPENTWLLNTIRRYDPNSAIASLMHVEWIAARTHGLEQRIIRDSITPDDYLSVLQLFYRMDVLAQEAERYRSLTVALQAPQIAWRYTEFIQTYLSERPLQDYYPLCCEEIRAARHRVEQWLLALPGLRDSTQISETMQAVVRDNTIQFIPL